MLDFAFGELNLKPDEFWELTWGEFIRMQKGYMRRVKLESMNVANVLAAIYNTIPRKKGANGYTANDFLPKESNDTNVSVDEHLKRIDKALDNAERFNKGVVYSEWNG